MAEVQINLTAVQVRDIKPSLAYGVPARLRLDSSDDEGLIRAAMPSSIPKDAVVSLAEIAVQQISATGGSLTLGAQRHSAQFTSKTPWSKRPAVTGSTATQTQTGGAEVVWTIPVTSDVQGFVSGTLPNYGWRLTSSDTTARAFYGSTASKNKPYLRVVYLVPAEAPTDLKPSGGAVSLAKPVLTFTTDDDVTAVQVQVDAAADEITPDFDSGEVTATAGLLDLAATAYAGLADGATTQWRARAKNPLGWSAWSEWVEFSRDDFATLSITSPGATTADGSPTVQWTFTGQTAWQAILRDAAGKVLANSGRQVGTDTAWTPAKGVTVDGATGTFEVRVEDGVDRETTPGTLPYAQAFQTFTFELSGSVPGMDSLTAEQDGVSPAVTLVGTRTDGVPDEVAIFRDGSLIARMPGADVFTGDNFEWTDLTARMSHPAVYRVAPITGSDISSDGPECEVTPVCKGLWLIDPETGSKAVLWGDDEGEDAAVEVAITHTPIGEDAEVSRRRLARLPRAGAYSGPLVDAAGVYADDSILALEEFADADAGTLYRLVVGDQNREVIVGDLDWWPTPLDGPAERHYQARFSWWARR